MTEKTLKTIKVDVTPLLPPKPMDEVLKHLDTLGADEVLEVTNDLPFIHLLPKLGEMGFDHQLEQLGEKSYLLRVWRRSGGKK
ncbi:MAG: DUF2249 domain-containing protein [Dehalococcoidia bacterium]|nr:DUF2249 domain-containing protein [Dehalococcoidia bacterium]